MDATNKQKNKKLAALTGAALSLPGLNSSAAIPADSIKTNVSYGHYAESDNRMRVDIYHADAVIPLSDRLELAFSLDRDTYSGATPAFSLPSASTNFKKYEENGSISTVDIVSGASALSALNITSYFLNTFVEFKDGQPYLDNNTAREIQADPFYQPIFESNLVSAQSFAVENANRLDESSINSAAPDSADVSIIPEPIAVMSSDVLIERVKSFIFDYVQSSGDFQFAFDSIIGKIADRNDALNQFNNAITLNRSIGPYLDKLDSLKPVVIENEFQTDLINIESDYKDKVAGLELDLKSIKQDYDTDKAAIDANFSSQQDALDDLYEGDKTKTQNNLTQARVDYNAATAQLDKDLAKALQGYQAAITPILKDYNDKKNTRTSEYQLEIDNLTGEILRTPGGKELQNQYAKDTTDLDATFTSQKINEFDKFSVATGFSETTDFETNKNSLYETYTFNEKTRTNLYNQDKATDLTNYNKQFSVTTKLYDDGLTQLDLQFDADKVLLNDARDAAELQYKQDNPRPADPLTIAETVTIDFPITLMTSGSYGGHANMAPGAGGSCPGGGMASCYYEDNFVIGVVEDPTSATAHLHRASGYNFKDKSLQYHADSSGIYIRAQSGAAFSLDSMTFKAPIDANTNKDDGQNDNWEILGFNQAVNEDLATGDGTNYATRVAYEKIANGFDGTLDLSSINSDFKNVNAVWIHYQGYPSTPTDGKEFSLKVDDIVLSPVITPTKTQIAWDDALQLFKTDYQTNTYDPNLNNLTSDYGTKKSKLESDKTNALSNLTADYNKELIDLKKAFDGDIAALTTQYNTDVRNLKKATDTYNGNIADFTTAYNTNKGKLDDDYIKALEELSAGIPGKIAELNDRYAQDLKTLEANRDGQKQPFLDELDAKKKELQDLSAQYLNDYQALLAKGDEELRALQAQYLEQSDALKSNQSGQESTLLESKIKELAQLTQNYLVQAQPILAAMQGLEADPAALRADAAPASGNAQADPTSIDEAIGQTRSEIGDGLATDKNKQEQAATNVKDAKLLAADAIANETAKAIANYLDKQTTIALYQEMLDRTVPAGDRPVQRFQVMPQETRTMPQFTARYFWDDTTLALSGGLSDEPDFLSNFGSVNLNHEFNDKLTTFNIGYGMTSNTITRGSSHAGGHNHCTDGSDSCPEYGALNEKSRFHNVNAGISQVLGKDTLYQLSASYTQQNGYLSNPYKQVYIRGEVTAEEYFEMNRNPDLDWRSITQLEMVSTELFREVRPNSRNMWSFSNRLNQHLPNLDASVHFDYRFYTDDWGIDSHTFELKWYQNLAGGFTVTPGIRYYSQSQADFFAPYFLAPRADGHYSSDFRLSGFGDLSGGITIGKEFARGIKLTAGFEYVTHSGNLKLGGGGIGDYADFDYYIAHANLNIDLGARPFTLGGGGGDHSHHHEHHHGAPIPAGVMFGHMMTQADEIMIGYRYMYGVQSGSMLSGSEPVSDTYLVANACPGNDNGCLFKPLKMHMQMHMLDLMYAPTDWLNIMLMPQLMSMDMTMSQPLRQYASPKPGEVDSEEDLYGHHAGARHTSNDLADTLGVALVKVFDDGTHHAHVGIGMSAPTGSVDVQLSQGTLVNNGGTAVAPNSAVLQDYGMQTGSGTWDFKPSLTYTGHKNDWGWGVQLSGTKHLGRNKYGFAYGDIIQGTSWGSYAIFDWLSASVRGAYTWQDNVQGLSDQNHDAVSPVDFPSNYGGRFVDVGFGLNLSIPEGQFAGHHLSVEWLQPVMTDFNGTQLDRDGAMTATWSFSF
ncbi:MAG: DUF3570 domain-containing protein [Gammaproteobacteria bacterium]